MPHATSFIAETVPSRMAAGRPAEGRAAVFAPNGVILEALRTSMRRDRRGRPNIDVSAACDHAGIEARRRVEQPTKSETHAA